MGRSLFSRTGCYHLQLILKAIMPCTEERSGLSSIASPFFPADKSGPQKKGAGYVRLRSGHMRLEEPQLKEVNTQSIPCCQDWISKVCYSAWNMATLNHMKQKPLNWITWYLINNHKKIIREKFWWKSISKLFSFKNYLLYGMCINYKPLSKLCMPYAVDKFYILYTYVNISDKTQLTRIIINKYY